MNARAIVLVRHGDDPAVFDQRQVPVPVMGDDEVGIQVSAFGINYADIMARRGMYAAAPPPPAVLGYEVVGEVYAVGKAVRRVQVGQRAVAFTRFGGYTTHAVCKEYAVSPIPEGLGADQALALATQYTTAYYAFQLAAPLYEGKKVLIHAAAGGVGSALLQLGNIYQCEMIATAGSSEKVAHIQQQGVRSVINYTQEDFEKIVLELTDGGGVDVIFESIGPQCYRKGLKVLSPGGKMIVFGAANRKKHWPIIGPVRLALQYGWTHPFSWLMQSQSLVGINMLKIADHQPRILEQALASVVELAGQKRIRPHVGKSFAVHQVFDAHRWIEQRQSIGKVVVHWDD